MANHEGRKALYYYVIHNLQSKDGVWETDIDIPVKLYQVLSCFQIRLGALTEGCWDRQRDKQQSIHSTENIKSCCHWEFNMSFSILVCLAHLYFF